MLILGDFGIVFSLVFSLIILSLATEYYQFLLIEALLIGTYLRLLYNPSVALKPLYFNVRRIFAMGITTASGSFRGIIYPIVFRQPLTHDGFMWANKVIAFIALLTLPLVAVTIKSTKSCYMRQLLEREAFLDLPYVTFMIAGSFLLLGVLIPFFLLIIYAESLGTSESLSFYMLFILNASKLLGRIIPAIASDWIGPELLLLSAQLAAGVLVFCWIAVRSTGSLIVWISFFGFVSGMIVMLLAAVLPYVCPVLSTYGTRLGMLYASGGLWSVDQHTSCHSLLI
jgi:hypothetical protein